MAVNKIAGRLTKQEIDIFKNFAEVYKFADEGPKEELDQTENTQPAIFLASYSIYEMIKRETNLDLNSAKYFAGHSLGEYSALTTSGALTFDQTIKLLKIRGKSMQSALPSGEGGMLAVLGSEVKLITEILNENKEKYECFIANDNSNGQIVVSGKNKDLEKDEGCQFFAPKTFNN